MTLVPLMSATRRRPFALLAAGVVSIGGIGLALAPGAQATPVSPCLGQTFTADGACTVESGETIAFTVQGAAGGDGGDAYGGSDFGGAGGLGARVTGSYTNTSGSVVTLDVYVGIPGMAGADGTELNPDGLNGSDGSGSAIVIDSTPIVAAGGGDGGTGAIDGVSDGNAGADGQMTIPASLPSGWTYAAAGGLPQVSFSAAPSGDSTGSASGQEIQQFGRPAVGTCDETQPDGLDWAGVAPGGWGGSWAQWMNNGTGGFVCTRTLVFSQTQGKWVVH